MFTPLENHTLWNEMEPQLKITASVRFDDPSELSNGVYSRTWMFFFLHMSFSIFGHTVTLTSPRCALLSRSM